MAKEEKALETEAVEEVETAETVEETAKKSNSKPEKTDKKPKAKKPGLFKRIARFFKDLKGEVKKIVWPTKSQVINNTIVVLVLCLIVLIFVFAWDLIMGFLRDGVFRNA